MIYFAIISILVVPYHARAAIPDVTIEVVQTPEGVYYIQSGALSALPPGGDKTPSSFPNNEDLLTGSISGFQWIGIGADATYR